MYITYNNLLFPNETLYNSEVSLNFVPSGITMNSVACLKKGDAQWNLKDQACTSLKKKIIFIRNWFFARIYRYNLRYYIK